MSTHVTENKFSMNIKLTARGIEKLLSTAVSFHQQAHPQKPRAPASHSNVGSPYLLCVGMTMLSGSLSPVLLSQM